MNQNRLKSKVLWASVIAQIISLLLALGVIDTTLGDPVNQITAGVLQLLVLFGVLNNPTDGESF